MPSNPDKEKMLARNFIDKILTVNLKDIKEISLNELMRQTLINYAVSEHFVESFIKRYYVDNGYVDLSSDNILTLKEADKK